MSPRTHTLLVMAHARAPVKRYVDINGAYGLMSTIILQPVSIAGEANQAAFQSTIGLAGSAVTRDKGVTADTNALSEAVAEGPVSVAIQANSPFFQLYTGGVFSSSLCGPSTME